MGEICASIQAQNGWVILLEAGAQRLILAYERDSLLASVLRFIELYASAAPGILQNSAILGSVPRHATPGRVRFFSDNERYRLLKACKKSSNL